MSDNVSARQGYATVVNRRGSDDCSHIRRHQGHATGRQSHRGDPGGLRGLHPVARHYHRQLDHLSRLL